MKQSIATNSGNICDDYYSYCSDNSGSSYETGDRGGSYT